MFVFSVFFILQFSEIWSAASLCHSTVNDLLLHFVGVFVFVYYFFCWFVFYVFVCIFCIFVSCIFPNSELVVPSLSNFMKRWAVGLASQSPKVVWKLCTVRTHDTHSDGFGHWLVITDHWDLQLELKESEWQNPIPIPIWDIMSTTFSDIIAEN